MTPTLDQPKMRNASTIALKAQALLGQVKTTQDLTVSASMSPAAPVDLAPIKSLPIEPVPTTETVTTTAPVAMTAPTIKTTQDTSNMSEKSGDTWLNITLPSNGTTTPSNSSGSTLTPEEKNQRGIIIASVILVVLVLTVWLMNRKPA